MPLPILTSCKPPGSGGEEDIPLWSPALLSWWGGEVRLARISSSQFHPTVGRAARGCSGAVIFFQDVKCLWVSQCLCAEGLHFRGEAGLVGWGGWGLPSPTAPSNHILWEWRQEAAETPLPVVVAVQRRETRRSLQCSQKESLDLNGRWGLEEENSPSYFLNWQPGTVGSLPFQLLRLIPDSPPTPSFSLSFHIESSGNPVALPAKAYSCWRCHWPWPGVQPGLLTSVPVPPLHPAALPTISPQPPPRATLALEEPNGLKCQIL